MNVFDEKQPENKKDDNAGDDDDYDDGMLGIINRVD